MTDLDKSQLLIQQKQTRLLEMYEGKIQALLQEKLDNLITEDEYKDKQEDIRRIFLHQFNENLKEVDITTPEIHFSNILTKSLLGQVRRAFGCYQAVENMRPVLQQYNHQLGEPVLESSFKSTMDIIEKLEKLTLTNDLMQGMDFSQDLINQVLANMVNREFPGKR